MMKESGGKRDKGDDSEVYGLGQRLDGAIIYQDNKYLQMTTVGGNNISSVLDSLY